LKILFLTLDTFSRTGGIQQFNRCFQLALGTWAGEHGGTITHWSLVDADRDVLPAYTPEATVQFRGFEWGKLKFFRHFFRHVSSFDLIVFGHVNLAPLALLPAKAGRKYWLMAHGVEVWDALSFFKRKGLFCMDKVLSVSHFTKEKLKTVHHFPADRIDLFPNCLDPFFAKGTITPETEWNKHWRLQTNRTYLLTLARLAATEQPKGYDAVIRVLPRLVEKYPDIAYLLAGKWEEPEYVRVRQLAESLGVGDRLLMPGFVKAEHLPALFSLAKVFVMPSSKEGFGIVFIEAAWWGCSVVAGRSGGTPEALLGGQLGEMVPANEEERLLEALTSSLEASVPRDQKLSHNRSLIESNFGFSIFCKRLDKLLQSSGFNP
jgi:glycosyltransferase involved in cell wall biosynthesis